MKALKTLFATTLCVFTLFSTSFAALDIDGNSWNYVGSFRVSDGPYWGDNPPVYSGLQAAELIFGSLPAGQIYAVSIFNNFVTHTAHYDGWADTTYMTGNNALPEDYYHDVPPPGYAYPYGLANAYSAFVRDHVNYNVVNYVWERTVPVPEPSTFIAGALLAIPFGVQGIRYLRNRKRA